MMSGKINIILCIMVSHSDKRLVSFLTMYDRIELFDEENSDMEDRYDTIGDLAAGHANTSMSGETVIGSTGSLSGEVNDIVFVVYTERTQTNDNGKKADVTRLISARLATDFERGLYYGKC